MRTQKRSDNELRPVFFTRNYTKYAEGSVLVEFGNTRVLCTASVQNSVPPFLKNSGRGWVTAEYGMLPRSTHVRMRRDDGREGRVKEIQRLIGRSIRSIVDFNALGERTIILDCDVLQADGGTRVAAINGACIALIDAVNKMLASSRLKINPLHGMVAAVSVGIVDGKPLLDLEYDEDSRAECDINIVMNEALRFIEVQGTAEGHAFNRTEFNQLIDLAEHGIKEIIVLQQSALQQ